MIVIGHVDAGKSTLMGHFLYKLGKVTDKQLNKYEKECKEIGKTTFHFAWAMDENLEERKRGCTMDIAYKYIETEKFFLTLMDAPGHRDFVPNMIQGAGQADCALLIIDSNKNAFEAGFFSGGQTREHATLAIALGVKQIIVVVNKMELSNWSEERFNYIQQQLDPFLINLGFKNIRYIPVSGLAGTNLIEVSNENKENWYGKDSLLSMINKFEVPERLNNYPTRFNITECGFSMTNNLNGFQIIGKLEGGNIVEGKEYCIFPLGKIFTVRTIYSNESKVSEIWAGDSAEMLLKENDQNLIELIKPGMYMCGIENPIPVVSELELKIIVLDIEMPLCNGQELMFHTKSDKTVGKITKIKEITQGKKVKKVSV